MSISRREGLLELRDKLLEQYTVEHLEALQQQANEKLAASLAIRKKRVNRSHHDLDSIPQMFNDLFSEIIENRKILATDPQAISDFDLAVRCGDVNPSHFLHKRERQYDSDPHIPPQHREDLKFIILALDGLFNVKPLPRHFSPKPIGSVGRGG